MISINDLALRFKVKLPNFTAFAVYNLAVGTMFVNNIFGLFVDPIKNDSLNAANGSFVRPDAAGSIRFV